MSDLQLYKQMQERSMVGGVFKKGQKPVGTEKWEEFRALHPGVSSKEVGILYRAENPKTTEQLLKEREKRRIYAKLYAEKKKAGHKPVPRVPKAIKGKSQEEIGKMTAELEYKAAMKKLKGLKI